MNRHSLTRDIAITVVGIVILSAFFFYIDAIDRWHVFTRAHEDWELDEFLGIILSILICCTALAIRHIFLLKELIKDLNISQDTLARHMAIQAHQEKFAALGQLSSGMAHEINNALQPVLGLSQIIKKRLKDQDQELYDHAATIEDSALHVRGLVENVLQFSKGRTDEKMSLQDAQARINQSIQLAKTLIPKTIELNYTSAESFNNKETKIYTTATGLSQIFINMFKNAAEAMEGEGLIKMHCEIGVPDQSILDYHQLPKQDYLIITISDTGPGIDPDIKDKIFDPFFTTKEQYIKSGGPKTAEGGTGLGLAIVYGIIRQHNGAIAVDDTPAEGCQFTLFLPISL